MQKDIHPKSKVVKFIMPDGSVLETLSTYAKDEFYCERSIKEHPAWNKSSKISDINASSAKLKSFESKYADFGGMFGADKKNKKNNNEEDN